MIPDLPVDLSAWKELSRWQREYLKESSLNLLRLRKWWEWWQRPPEVKVGTTPKEIVYRENKASLYHYHPVAAEVKPLPVLIVYALINRFYILDLNPERSFIKYLLDHGLDVYAIDWGTAGDEDRHIPLDEYIAGSLDRMVKRVISLSGSPQISLFGYCIGGTLAATYAALHPERIKNLVLLTAPINFAEGGYLSRMVDKDHFPLDAFVETYGNIPPWLIQAGFKLLNPLGDLAKSYDFIKYMHDDRFTENFLAIETWINDNVPFPGEAFRKFIRDFYQENKLYRGLLEIDGCRVDLKRITANHLTVAARDDTIVPPASAISIQELISSRDRERVILPGGHVGVIIGGRALKLTWPRIADWLMARSNG